MDTINEEILRIKRELAARFDNDLNRIVADAKSRETNTITMPRRPWKSEQSDAPKSPPVLSLLFETWSLATSVTTAVELNLFANRIHDDSEHCTPPKLEVSIVRCRPRSSMGEVAIEKGASVATIQPAPSSHPRSTQTAINGLGFQTVAFHVALQPRFQLLHLPLGLYQLILA